MFLSLPWKPKKKAKLLTPWKEDKQPPMSMPKKSNLKPLLKCPPKPDHRIKRNSSNTAALSPADNQKAKYKNPIKIWEKLATLKMLIISYHKAAMIIIITAIQTSHLRNKCSSEPAANLEGPNLPSQIITPVSQILITSNTSMIIIKGTHLKTLTTKPCPQAFRTQIAKAPTRENVFQVPMAFTTQELIVPMI